MKKNPTIAICLLVLSLIGSIRAEAFLGRQFETPSKVSISGFSPKAQKNLEEILQEVTATLNSTNWSEGLRQDLVQTWNITNKRIAFMPLTADKENEGHVIALASPFPFGMKDEYEGAVYLKESLVEKGDTERLFEPILHELRHLRDFYEAWNTEGMLYPLSSEQNAYTQDILIILERGKSGYRTPVKYKNEWVTLEFSERKTRVMQEVGRFLLSNPYYQSKSIAPITFTKNRQIIRTNGQVRPRIVEPKRTWASGTLPPPNVPSATIGETFALPGELNPELEIVKPSGMFNPEDLLEKTFRNEGRLRKQLNEYALSLQYNIACFTEKNIISRTFSQGVAPLQNGDLLTRISEENETIACAPPLETIQYDATRVFWLNENPEMKESRFLGVDRANKDIAVFLYDPQKFPQVDRAFIGTFFVSIKDAQIVEFYGEVQGSKQFEKGKERLNYLVSAWRQRTASGVWLTTLMRTRGLENGKPFRYEVKYDYKATKTDVKILDDDGD